MTTTPTPSPPTDPMPPNGADEVDGADTPPLGTAAVDRDADSALAAAAAAMAASVTGAVTDAGEAPQPLAPPPTAPGAPRPGGGPPGAGGTMVAPPIGPATVGVTMPYRQPPPTPPPKSLAFGWAPPLDPRPWRLIVWALVGGLVFDLGTRGGVDNLVVALGVLVVVVALVTDQRVKRTESRWVAAAAVVPALCLGIWSSPWLVTTNVLAVVVLLGVAIAHSQSGSLFDTSPLRLLIRGVEAGGRALIGPVVLRGATPKMSTGTAQKAGRIGVALLVAVPPLAIVVALLASADAVFASFVAPDVEVGPAVGHVVLTVCFAGAIVCVAASALGDSKVGVQPGKFGVLEIVTILGLTAAVLGLFVVSQLVALTGAGERLVEESGLTPADYARSGFFQLCWAAFFLLILLAITRALAAPGIWSHMPVRVLAGVVPILAGGLVVVSLRRMQLYDQAFGLTMLRLWVVGAALWMGSLLVMIALRNAGIGGGRNWVLGGAVASSLVLVLAANAANPEAFVVRHNVARAADGAELDTSYLSDLSDDAVPAMVDALDDVDGLARGELMDALSCHNDAIGADAVNLSAKRSADARHDAGIRPASTADRYAVCGTYIR